MCCLNSFRGLAIDCFLRGDRPIAASRTLNFVIRSGDCEMSDQWFYRIQGQEYGPVSLDLVRSLVVSGVIAPDDEVRDLERSNWILACAASELRGSTQQRSIDLAEERRHQRDQWYCRGATGDYGPLKLVDLIELAVRGELSPDEEIKARVDDYWRQIHTFERLLELLPFPDEIREISQNCSQHKLAAVSHLGIYHDDAELIPTFNRESASRSSQEEDHSDSRDDVLEELRRDNTISSVIPFPGVTTTTRQVMDTESIARWTFPNR